MRRASGSVIPLRSSSSSIPALLHDTPTYWPQYTVPGFLRRYGKTLYLLASTYSHYGVYLYKMDFPALPTPPRQQPACRWVSLTIVDAACD